MEITNIHEAKSQLSRLIDVRLVPIPSDQSPRVGGQWKDRVEFADDFDVLPDEPAEAFGMRPE